MSRLAVVFVSLLLSACFSLVIDRPDSIVKGWREFRKSDALQEIKLTFAVQNQNVELLHDTLMAVSTPGHAEYGRHKTVAELYEMIAPSADSIDAVQDWLLSHFDAAELIHETPNRDLWSVVTTIGTAEKLLDCEYYDYISDVDGASVVSRVQQGTSYHVPDTLAPHLYFVSPTHRFPYLNARVQSSTVGRGDVNPSTLRTLYNLGDAKGAASNNSMAVASFRNQYYDIADCQAMWKKYNIQPSTVTNVPSDEPVGHHLEAELDTQYMSCMGQAIPMQVWWTRGLNFDDALVSWTQDVLSSKTAAPLFSVSYGGPESDFGQAYTSKLDNDLAMMGAAGISVLFAAGDSGAGGGCSEDDPFVPDYPASSPYVTAVGGVEGGSAGKSPLGESVWQDGGGGFSNYAPTQSWQRDAVRAYLSNTKNMPDATKFNASGRGYPDIAAQSVDFEIIADGKTEAVSGTSCASPTAGGIFALLNDVRAQNGMSKLGFLNPLIYQLAATDATAFNDCTEGYNAGCSPGVERGFPAAAKWDAASGNGSPNYAVLKEKVLQTGKQTMQHKEEKSRVGQLREKIRNRLQTGEQVRHGQHVL